MTTSTLRRNIIPRVLRQNGETLALETPMGNPFSQAPLRYCADLDRSPQELLIFAARRKRKYRDNLQAVSTVKGYLAQVAPWCSYALNCGINAEASAPDDLADYLGAPMDTGERSKSYVEHALTAIRTYIFTRSGLYLDSLALRTVRRYARKRLVRHAPRLYYADMIRMCNLARSQPHPRRLRDLAILLLLWHTSCRPSELWELCAESINIVPYGMQIRIARSKTDQAGKGQWITIACAQTNHPYCAVHALQDWLSVARISNGYIFRAIDRNGYIRSPKTGQNMICELVKAYAEHLALPGIVAYSFRRGSVTEALERGASRSDVQLQLRHESEKSAEPYIEKAPVPPARSISRLLW